VTLGEPVNCYPFIEAEKSAQHNVSATEPRFERLASPLSLSA
jgi:hypothetical protein